MELLGRLRRDGSICTASYCHAYTVAASGAFMLDFYDQLIDEGESGISRLVEDRTQEGLELEVKEKHDSSHGRFDEPDKKVLAKALSSFSNSAGGVIIFGLRAKSVGGSVDCVQAPPYPISDIQRFRAEALTLVGSLLQPKNEGIKVESIASFEKPGAGFLVIYVPRSGRRPHRSEAKDQKQYFKRVGASSYAMEHYDIEDAFRRSDSAELELAWDVERASVNGAGTSTYVIVLKLANHSGVTAKYPYLYLADVPVALNYTHPPSRYLMSIEGKWTCFYAGADHVVNPETKSTVVRLTAGITKDLNGKVTASANILSFNYRLGSENVRIREGLQIISFQNIYDAVIAGPD